jgi:YXWGXW repeat-containing protein
MLKRFALLASLTLLLGVAYVQPAQARTRFSFQIGVGRIPPPGYVWQEGYYAWTGYGRHWVPGTWVPSPYGYGRRDWARERWERRSYYRDRDWRDRGRRDWDRNRDRNRGN